MADYIKLVKNTIDILKLLSNQANGMGVREIGRELDINKSTCHRMLTTLEKEGMVTFDKTTQKYLLSLGTLQIVSNKIQHDDLVTIALPYMSKLRDLTGETIGLHIPVLNHRIVIAQIESVHELHWKSIVGKPYELHLGAASKVITAFLKEKSYNEVLDRLPPNFNKNKLIDEIEKIRSSYFATSFGEVQTGGVGIAAPIIDKSGNIRASISIHALENRMKGELDEVIDYTKNTANNITNSLF